MVWHETESSVRLRPSVLLMDFEPYLYQIGSVMIDTQMSAEKCTLLHPSRKINIWDR